MGPSFEDGLMVNHPHLERLPFPTPHNGEIPQSILIKIGKVRLQKWRNCTVIPPVISLWRLIASHYAWQKNAGWGMYSDEGEPPKKVKKFRLAKQRAPVGCRCVVSVKDCGRSLGVQNGWMNWANSPEHTCLIFLTWNGRRFSFSICFEYHTTYEETRGQELRRLSGCWWKISRYVWVDVHAIDQLKEWIGGGGTFHHVGI